VVPAVPPLFEEGGVGDLNTPGPIPLDRILIAEGLAPGKNVYGR
jgi:hypothetical protein